MADIAPKTAAAIDEWQTEEQVKPMRRGTVRLFTQGLSAAERRLTGVEIIDDKDALMAAISRSAGKDGRVAVIPEGPYILPFVK